jgi:hypothetical protein
MTRIAVEQKLSRLINDLPKNERDVVYAFVKIRKLLEFERAKKRHPFLSVFCDWLLHTRLDGRGAQSILEILDEKMVQKKWRPEDEPPDREVFDIFSLDLFRGDLRTFLQANGLPTVWVDDMFAWQAFIVFYGDEVVDTPLAMTRRDGKAHHLTKLVIEACEPSKAIAEVNPHEHFSGFKWALTLNGGHTFVVPHTFNLVAPPVGWKLQGVQILE